MKKLLYAFIGFTVLTPLAYADQSYELSKVSCESGSEVKIDLADPQLSMATGRLTFSHREYELQPVGLPNPGNTYIQVYRAFASSDDQDSAAAPFVSVSEDKSKILVRRLDEDLSVCGGGFISFEYTAKI